MTARRPLGRRLRRQLERPIGNVRLRGRIAAPYWRYRFDSFGAGSVMYRPLWVQGAHKIAIGEAGLFMRCSLTAEERTWNRAGPTISLGDRVIVLAFASIGAAESIIIEDDVAIGAFAMIRDCEHQRRGRGEWTESHAEEGLKRPVGNPTGFGPIDIAPVRIGRGAAIGERVAVLPGSQIGKHSFIGTNSVVRGTIPDYSIAVGAPARVIGTTRVDAAGRDSDLTEDAARTGLPEIR